MEYFRKEKLSVDADWLSNEIFKITKDWQFCAASSNIPSDQETEYCQIDLYSIPVVRSVLESSVGGKVYNTATIVDFHHVTGLREHIDDIQKINHGFQFVCIVPLYGRSIEYIYEGREESVLSSVEFGPGDILVLNNTKYYHSMTTLDDTRITLMMWIEDANYSIENANCSDETNTNPT